MTQQVLQVPYSVLEIPTVQTTIAMEKGVAKRFLFKTWGGLGDVVCAEPTLRYALKNFHDCEISLATETPELFEHLKFQRVFDLRKEKPDWEGYLCLETIKTPTSLLWAFISHCITHAVDFSSICAIRMQLPVADKEIRLPDFDIEVSPELEQAVSSAAVVVHAGKHWPSKTFPRVWWDSVIEALRGHGFLVVLIGKEVDENVGFVDVDPRGCLDLRNRTSLKEMVWLLKNSKLLLSNDSAAIHIAASGNAFIGFVASCKHPDYLMHWRQGEFGWRTKNFGLDGLWNHLSHNPAQENEVTVDKMDPALWERILPDPQKVANYYASLNL